jgi:hypothetical protein
MMLEVGVFARQQVADAVSDCCSVPSVDVGCCCVRAGNSIGRLLMLLLVVAVVVYGVPLR